MSADHALFILRFEVPKLRARTLDATALLWLDIVVTLKRLAFLPLSPSSLISLATWLWPHVSPSAFSSACTLGAP
jgi:hypothetical protein